MSNSNYPDLSRSGIDHPEHDESCRTSCRWADERSVRILVKPRGSYDLVRMCPDGHEHHDCNCGVKGDGQ